MFTTSQGISYNRIQWADFSYPTRFEDLAIIMPSPDERQKAAVIIQCFTWKVIALTFQPDSSTHWRNLGVACRLCNFSRCPSISVETKFDSRSIL